MNDDENQENPFPDDIWREIMGQQPEETDSEEANQKEAPLEDTDQASDEGQASDQQEQAPEGDVSSQPQAPSEDTGLEPTAREHIAAEEGLLDYFEPSDIKEKPPANTEELSTTPGGVDNVPVHLNFRLKKQQIPLSKLSQLEPGFSFDLALDLSAPVTLEANGTAIARCELVEIGGRLGARIVKLLS